MDEKNMNNTFVPCGDSMEKMEKELHDYELAQVAGGANAMQTFKRCPRCMRSVPPIMIGETELYYFKSCKEQF